jgi:hypothetical protein
MTGFQRTTAYVGRAESHLLYAPDVNRLSKLWYPYMPAQTNYLPGIGGNYFYLSSILQRKLMPQCAFSILFNTSFPWYYS